MANIGTFDGKGNVGTWITTLDLHFYNKEIPQNERLLFALQHLSQPVRDCVFSLSAPLESVIRKSWNWTWVKLKAALRGIQQQIGNKGFFTEELISKAAKVACVAGVAAIAGPPLIAGGLGVIGFSAAGPVAGSIAAGIQSVFYGAAVPAGSAFAFCQSLAMGGYAVGVAAGAGAVGAGAAEAARQAIADKPPSKSWDDGVDFKPSMRLIDELLKLEAQD